MADLQNRLEELDQSLDQFDAKDTAPAAIADVFNALLGEAKSQRGSDPVIAAIEPAKKSFEESEFAEVTCGALKAMIQQLRTALAE